MIPRSAGEQIAGLCWAEYEQGILSGSENKSWQH